MPVCLLLTTSFLNLRDANAVSIFTNSDKDYPRDHLTIYVSHLSILKAFKQIDVLTKNYFSF